MGEMADDHMEQYFEDIIRNYERSTPLTNRLKRYDVTDDEIREFLFNISTSSLCKLADKVLMEYYPEEVANDIEMNKIIDIAAFGISKMYLTNKQKWCLASFCIYYLREGKSLE